jgi:hypothetical protein
MNLFYVDIIGMISNIDECKIFYLSIYIKKNVCLSVCLSVLYAFSPVIATITKLSTMLP